MEHNIKEIEVVEEAVTESVQKQLLELNDLHLALVGGGVGETIL